MVHSCHWGAHGWPTELHHLRHAEEVARHDGRTGSHQVIFRHLDEVLSEEASLPVLIDFFQPTTGSPGLQKFKERLSVGIHCDGPHRRFMLFAKRLQILFLHRPQQLKAARQWHLPFNFPHIHTS